MRRSSTTVSGPATVRLRRYGEKLPPTTSGRCWLQGSKLLASSRMPRQLTVRRALHRLSTRPCARCCCYGSCINGKEEPARLDAVYTW